jgi:hypothetical protein
MEDKKLQPEESQIVGFKSESQLFEDSMKHEIPFFVQMHEEAMKLMQESRSKLGPKYFNKLWNANEINSKMQGLLFDMFPDQMRMTKDGRFYFLKEGKYIILFKKLDRDFFPSNNPTKSSNAILYQQSMQFNLPVVFVGYVPSSTWDSFKNIMAVYISNKSIIWQSDLIAAAKGQSIIQLPAFDMGKQTENDEPQVKIK